MVNRKPLSAILLEDFSCFASVMQSVAEEFIRRSWMLPELVEEFRQSLRIP